MRKRNILMTTLAGTLALGGLGGAYAASNGDKVDGEEAAEIAAVMSASNSLGDAVRLAEAETNGKAFEAGMEDKDGNAVYEIRTVAGDVVRELSIDPATGKVLESDEEGMFSKLMRDDEELAGFAAATTSLGDAITAAEQATGGKAIEAEMDDDAANSAYEVEVAAADGSVVKVTVDGASGKVLASGPLDNDNEEHDDN